ncbi:sugar phosphate isomerase/epimerase [Lacticaseibacillus jixiensis]|uniref:sugar phosphate isomerase/epimerase n=1 Tax=Lacticaseibacillus jixiensis TaxID=3231926 RepID=UPI0036F19D92
MQLGLKASTDEQQIDNRLQHHPDVFEFHLTEADFTPAGWAHFEAMVAKVQAVVPRVVFHHPMKYQGLRCELCVNKLAYPALYEFVMTSSKRLIEFAKQVGAVALIHGGYGRHRGEHDFTSDWPDLATAQKVVLGRMVDFTAMAPDNVVFENSILPVFAYGDPAFEAKLLALQLPLAFDVSHAFIYVHGDNNRLIASMRHLRPFVRHYHLVDSMGLTHDSLIVGNGAINWRRVLHAMNSNASMIYEINLANQWDCSEMLASQWYLEQLAEKDQSENQSGAKRV